MDFEFKWVGGATWIMKIQGLKIACDPVLCPAGTIQDYKVFKTKRLNDPIFTEDDFEDIDLWLITHGHEDHLDKAGLSRIKQGSKVVTHKNALGRLREIGKVETNVLETGEKTSFEIKNLSINIEAMPAVHKGGRWFQNDLRVKKSVRYSSVQNVSIRLMRFNEI